MHLKLTTIAVLALGASLAVVSVARGGQPGAAPTPAGDRTPAAFQDPTNAALLYYKTWLEPGWKELSKACSDTGRCTDPLWKPDADLDKLLEEHQGIVRMLIRAGRAPSADFGIEYSQGINAELPHLSWLRAGARVLGCDARRLLFAGDTDGACERVAAMYRAARHCTSDRAVISSLVSIAITSLADTQVRVIIDTNRLSTSGKQSLLAEAARLAGPDGWSMRRNIDAERRWTLDWLRRTGVGPDAGQKIVDQFRNLNLPIDVEATTRLSGMDEAAVGKSIDDCDRCFGDALKAWDGPNAQKDLRDLGTGIARGDYGVISKFVAPLLGRCYQSDSAARAEHDALLSKLEYFIPVSR